MKPLTAFIAFLFFVMALAAVPYLLSKSGYEHLLIPKFWVLFCFVTFLTLIVVAAIIFTQYFNPAIYAQVFLATTIIKMIGSMAFALVFVLKIHINQAVFLADFCYIYFLNTGFEVYLLLRNLRNQN